jgi:hypothetical protein
MTTVQVRIWDENGKAVMPFDGSNYEAKYDGARLTKQLLKIFAMMETGHWHTLREISLFTGVHEPSVSAQLRNLRKPAFGAHKVNKQPRGDRGNGLWEYQLIPNTNDCK